MVGAFAKERAGTLTACFARKCSLGGGGGANSNVRRQTVVMSCIRRSCGQLLHEAEGVLAGIPRAVSVRTVLKRQVGLSMQFPCLTCAPLPVWRKLCAGKCILLCMHAVRAGWGYCFVM